MRKPVKTRKLIYLTNAWFSRTRSHIFVSRVGGTGKSFLIEAIKDLVGSIWSMDDLVCAIAAPTGLAAFNVGGIHKLFQLPIEHIQQRQLAIGPCQKPLRRS